MTNPYTVYWSYGDVTNTSTTHWSIDAAILLLVIFVFTFPFIISRRVEEPPERGEPSQQDKEDSIFDSTPETTDSRPPPLPRGSTLTRSIAHLIPHLSTNLRIFIARMVFSAVFTGQLILTYRTCAWLLDVLRCIYTFKGTCEIQWLRNVLARNGFAASLALLFTFPSGSAFLYMLLLGMRLQGHWVWELARLPAHDTK